MEVPCTTSGGPIFGQVERFFDKTVALCSLNLSTNTAIGSGCWISTQWKLARYQSTSVIPTSPNSLFVHPDASSSAPYPQELHQWKSSIEEPLHSSTVEKSERQKQYQELRCQSGPSAKDSAIVSGGDS